MRIYLKNLLEQQDNYISYKFEFSGIVSPENDKNMYLKLTSKGLKSNLVNTDAKGTGEKYFYTTKYITPTQTNLETLLGMTLEFSKQLSKEGDVVFKMSTDIIGKDMMKKLYAISVISIMVGVRKGNGETSEPIESPEEKPESTPEAQPKQEPVEKSTSTVQNTVPKKKQPNQYQPI